MLACLICLTSLEFSDDSAMCIPSCGHVFHQQCILRCCQLIEMNHEKSCPKCRSIFNPDQLVKLFFGSITDSSDDESNEIDTVLEESEACLNKINRMMRKMEGVDKDMTRMVANVKSLSDMRKIKRVVKDSQRMDQLRQKLPETEDLIKRYNLKDLVVLLSPLDDQHLAMRFPNMNSS